MVKWLIDHFPYLVLIFIVWLIFSLPFFWQGRIPFPSSYLVNNFVPWQYYYGLPVKNAAMPDVGSQIFPWRYVSILSFKNKQWPLWNPYNFSGTPLLANFQSAPFHPLNFLFFILPTIEAWSLLILLQPIAAALFTFLYLREIKLSSSSAFLGSLAFAFCGFMVCWLAYGTLPWAILWLPLALFSVEKFLKKNWWAGPLLSLSLALSLFSGHFQISLYLLCTVFLYLLFKGKQTKNWSKLIPPFLYSLLGVLLALPQILPTLEFYQQSVRSQSFRVAETIPLKYLFTFLSPDFYGNPVTRNDWFGHYAEWASFIGVIPAILAFYGLIFKKKDSLLKFFSFLAALSLLIAIRSPVQAIISQLKIPVFSTSAFSRIIVLFSFSFAILSAFGFEQFKKDWQSKKFKKSFFFFSIFGLIFLLIWTRVFFFKFEPSGAIDARHTAKRNLILPSLIFLSASVIIFVGFLKKNWQKLFIVAILLLTAFDSLRFASKWQPFDLREFFYPQLEVIKVLQEKTKAGERVFGNFGGELNVFQIPGIEGYDPLFIRRYGEFITTASSGKIGQPTRSTIYLDKGGDFSFKILNLLGVKYLLHAKEDNHHVWTFPFWQYPESFELVWEDEQYQVLENKEALPRAFLVYDYKIAKNDQEIIDLMLSEKTNLKKTIVLEEKPNLEIEDCYAPQPQDTVKILKYTPNEIEMEVDSSCQSLLFLSDIFYPGWQAFIDQQKTDILRANFAFRSIAMPAGKHQVVFVYSAPLFKKGLIFSAASLILLVFISLYWRKNENRSF